MGFSFAAQQPVTKNVTRLITPNGTFTYEGLPTTFPVEQRMEPYVTTAGVRVHEVLQRA